MIIIGEKLNGSIPSVGEAIAKRDETFLRQRVMIQTQAGADFIDVCASVDVSNEVETLKWMIGLVESVTDLPICLDSPNPAALVAAMPFCSRPGLINSVSLEGKKLSVIFPAIADTAWQCVALLCDDAGIPDSVEKRLSILRGVIQRADAYGIAHSRLFIDPLVLALSADASAQVRFSDCARAIRQSDPDVHITSGLSNISFGLPQRKSINQAFLVLAMAAGMDSAILDPTNRELCALIHATDALLGRDENGLRYIGYIHSIANPVATDGTPGVHEPASHAITPSAPKAGTKENGAYSGISAVYDAVTAGNAKQMEAIVSEALEAGTDPLAVLNDGMVAAMSAIGERFSRGEVFVPEMLISARAMKKGIAVLKPHLSSGATDALGKVVLGTVAGDLHDIGKNLVGIMIESAGFELVDLGVDVPPDAFVDAVKSDPGVRIVGLSSLLTTSMPAMRETVAMLSALENRKNFFVMVGGAPVTEAFANEIGADAYTADAASAAARAKALVSSIAQLRLPF